MGTEGDIHKSTVSPLFSDLLSGPEGSRCEVRKGKEMIGKREEL